MALQVKDPDNKTNTIKFLDYWLAENGYYENHRHDVNFSSIFIYEIASIYDDKGGEIAVYRATGSQKGIIQAQERILEINMNDPEFFDKFGNFLNTC